MKQILQTGRIAMIVALLILLATAGCSKPPDMHNQRLAEFAREAMTEQRKQNDRIADQSKAVVQESRQLAEAAKEMIASDAEAGRELVAAQKELNVQLNEQRSAVDAGRDDLEQEHRQIAEQRNRDPLVAAAIRNASLIIACSLPLVVCIFVIRQMRSEEPDDDDVAEFLVHELAGDEPTLLLGPTFRPFALPHSDSSSTADAATEDASL